MVWSFSAAEEDCASSVSALFGAGTPYRSHCREVRELEMLPEHVRPNLGANYGTTVLKALFTYYLVPRNVPQDAVGSPRTMSL